jgi:hypothetical protein
MLCTENKKKKLRLFSMFEIKKKKKHGWYYWFFILGKKKNKILPASSKF